MSLESQVESLTAAVAKLTTVTEQLIELRANAIETVKTAAAPAAKAEAKKAAAPAASSPVETPAAAEAAPTAAAADATDPYAEAKDLVGTYTKGSDRPEEVEARKLKIRGLLRHERLVRDDLEDATKFSVTDVKKDQLPVLIKNLKALIDKGDLTQPAAAAGDDLL